MWERIRGEWIEGKIQNLLMVLRYNKDNLVWENKAGFKRKVIMDCCVWYVKRWKLNKIGMKGVIDIEFENGETITLKYYPKKRPLVLNPDEQEFICFSTLMDKIIGYEEI